MFVRRRRPDTDFPRPDRPPHFLTAVTSRDGDAAAHSLPPLSSPLKRLSSRDARVSIRTTGKTPPLSLSLSLLPLTFKPQSRATASAGEWEEGRKEGRKASLGISPLLFPFRAFFSHP